jgi:hypothetical protein
MHRTKKSTGRLFMAGLGFAAAYFLDPTLGRERRQHVSDLVARARRARAVDSATVARDEMPRIGGSELGPRATFIRAARL